jgi:hypothetical protein
MSTPIVFRHGWPDSYGNDCFIVTFLLDRDLRLIPMTLVVTVPPGPKVEAGFAAVFMWRLYKGVVIGHDITPIALALRCTIQASTSSPSQPIALPPGIIVNGFGNWPLATISANLARLTPRRLRTSSGRAIRMHGVILGSKTSTIDLLLIEKICPLARFNFLTSRFCQLYLLLLRSSFGASDRWVCCQEVSIRTNLREVAVKPSVRIFHPAPQYR